MMRRLCAALLALALAGPAAAQISGVGAVIHPLNKYRTTQFKDLTTFANGPRLVSANGGFWFLESNADRIAFFKDNVITEWPIRSPDYPDPYRKVAATPADFQLDGSTIWFIENGTSGIEVNESVLGKLDTTTGEMTEWILPLAKPAGFIREPDGVTVWIAMSQGSLVKLRLDTLEVTGLRAPDSVAYSGLIRGPDGFLYLTDFGNNRVVRFDENALTETSWTLSNPAAQLEITQPTFDPQGRLLVAEVFNGGAVGRLDFSTLEYDRFGAAVLYYPSHFFLQGGFIYGVETSPFGEDGAIFVLDTTKAAPNPLTATMSTGTFTVLPLAAARVRTFTLTPQTFQSSDTAPDGLVVAGNPAAGISLFKLPSGTTLTTSTTYSIAASQGKIFAGARGALAEFTLLPASASTDLAVPLALNQNDGSIRTDFLAYNSAAQTGPLTVSLFSSPAPPPRTGQYNFGADGTLFVADALGASKLNAGDADGSLVFSPHVGDENNYQALTRTYGVRPDGGTFGFEMPARPFTSGLSPGASEGELFLPADADVTGIFGLFAPTGAEGTAVLRGPDGQVRGSLPFFLPSNNRIEYNPAFPAFGVPADLGDSISFDVTSGTLLPYVVQAEKTGDVAVAGTATASSSMVYPFLGAGPGTGGTLYVSRIFFGNPDPSTPVTVDASFYPVGGGGLSVVHRTIVVPAGGTRTLNFDGSTPGFGAITATASSPVFSQARIANLGPQGNYSALTGPSEAGSRRFLVATSPGGPTYNLFLFNAGASGTATIRGYDRAGTQRKELTVEVPSGVPVTVANVAVAAQIFNGGRIEVEGSSGTALYAMIAGKDPKTGDAFPQPGFPIPASQ
jgi:hypothetical protein